MILLQLKQYIRDKEKVTFSDVCNKFDVSPDTANALIDRLEQQGHVQRLSGQQCDSQCSSTCSKNEDWLQWLNHRYPPLKL